MRTLFSVKWLAMLVLALAVAGAFAALGKWQLDRAYRATPDPKEAPTESVAALQDVVEPGSLLRENAVGQKVTAEGSYAPGDFIVVTDRTQSGRLGYWVTGHFVLEEGGSIAVALGWAPSREAADSEAESLNSDGPDTSQIDGRVVSTEAPELDEDRPREVTTMAVPWLLNLWGSADGPVYDVYVLSADAPDGLTPISAPPPEQKAEVNWLNIFYAVEWVVFAGFAVFLWYRLGKDAWEKERELVEGVDDGSDGSAQGPDPQQETVN